MRRCLFFLIFIGLLLTQRSIAQGPNAPEAFGFEPTDASDMVNLLTGDLNYVLPLLNIPSPEGNLPLTINYHGGIAVNQEASWVGLGWSINPGAINRTVNGLPDDWKEGVKASIINDAGGVGRTSSLSFGVGFEDDNNITLGGGYSWTNFRSVSGETTFNSSFSFGVGAKTSAEKAAARNGKVYGAGVGITVSKGSAPGGYLSYTDGNNNNYSVNYSKQSGLGISIDYRWEGGPVSPKKGAPNKSIAVGGSIGITGGEINSYGSSIQSFSQIGAGLNISLDLALFNISYSSSKFRIWTFDEKTYGATGALYSGDLDAILQQKALPNFHAYDSQKSYSFLNNELNNVVSNSPAYVSYDQYSLTGPGLSGTMNPRILESYFLHSESSNFSTDNEIISKGSYQNLKLKSIKRRSTGSSKKIGSTNLTNSLNFYFENTISSYYKINEAGSWNVPNTITTDIGLFLNSTNTNQSIETSGYYNDKGRLVKGNYTESFTNLELTNNPNLLLSPEIDRTGMDPNAIGGFKITDVNGKTYYYSIPVLEKEKFTKISKLEDNYVDNYVENQSLTPYATHWLLTAITGPDFIDVTLDGQIDQSDYGYWVKYNYGKLSDGFGWRVPLEGNSVSSSHKSYSWGVKELYYLNTIKTRTHTAVFVKDIRNDHQGISNQIGTSRTNQLYKNAQFSVGSGTPTFVGSDGNYYFPGAYSTISSPPNIAYTGGTFLIENWFYAKSFIQNNLYLKKIILIKNEDLVSDPSLTTNLNGKIGNDLVSDFLFEEQVSIQQGGNGYVYPKNEYVDNRYYGNYLANLILDTDISNLLNTEKIIKSVVFNYDYELANNTPNSSSSGRLTLKSIDILNKNNETFMPPYNFDYYNDYGYAQENSDQWGFNKDSPRNWSLKKITTPVGSTINIDYESDDFSIEAGKRRMVFDFNLEAKFIELNGEKFVRVRNKLENEAFQNVDFIKYYTIGTYEDIDVQFWRNPNGNDAHGIADVAASCLVTDVSSSYVEFKLPPPNLNLYPTVRRDSDCNKTSWIFYSRFDYVVSRTNDWNEEKIPQDCGDPGDSEEKLKIRIFSKKQTINTKGGGVRVKEIDIRDENESYITKYSYNVLGFSSNPESSSYLSSGVTSYSPSVFSNDIPHIDLLPAPMIMYNYVTTIDPNNTKTVYKFNVLTQFEGLEPGNINYDLSGILEVKNEYTAIETVDRSGGGDFDIFRDDYHIEDNRSSLGRLIKQEVYNSSGQIINKTNYDYFEKDELNVTQESFKIFEDINGIIGNNQGSWFANMGSTSKIEYPSILKSTTTTSGGTTSKSEYSDFDPITGEPIQTNVYSSNGVKFKTKSIPAYTIPEYNPVDGYGMGSKVDDITNKNMLTQQAASFTYLIDDTGQEKVLNASINTWNNDWQYYNQGGTLESTPPSISQKIWRKHKGYIWKGSLNNDGAYANYTSDYDGFDWGIGEEIQPEQWQRISETTQYDHYSMPLESMDINGNYASTHMGYNNSKIIATSNAAFGEGLYTGLEHDSQPSYYIDDQILGSTKRTSEKAHTGSYSAVVTPSDNTYQTSFGGLLRANRHRAGIYRVSVWVHKDNHENAGVKYSYTGTPQPFNGEKVFAGDWVQLNHYYNRSENQTVNNALLLIGSLSGTIYADDYRIHPVQSTMSSYVYNEWDELTHDIGANNMATRYEYDDAGRLKRIYEEVADTPTIIGGFKQVAEYNQNYKRDISNPDPDPDPDPDPNPDPITIISMTHENSINFTTCEVTHTSGLSGLSGGSGNYSFSWSYKIGINGTYTSIPGNTSASSYLYNSQDPNCEVAFIYFKCVVSDNDIANFSVTFDSPARSTNCSCNPE